MAISYLTPGVYVRPAERVRPVGPLVRSDVTAFLGYSRRGPVFRPVRIESWREFLAHFGEPYAVGYLAPAVRAFFENGGTTCWIVRVADPLVSEASFITEPVSVFGDDYRWRFSASFNPTFLDEPEGAGLDDPTTVGEGDAGGVSPVRRFADAGAWGNQLGIAITRDVGLRTRTLPGTLHEGHVTAVEGLGGLEPNAIVELHQEGVEDAVIAIRTVDYSRGLITWTRSLAGAGFDLTRPIQIVSVELGVRVLVGGRIVESFRRLGLHPDHPRALLRVVHHESRYLDVELLGPQGTNPVNLPWTLPDLWPVGLDTTLAGGTDGVTTVSAADYERALEALRRIDEIGLLAAPDLVLRAAPAPSRPPATPTPPACASLEPRPTGVVFGRVVTRLDAEGADQPVAGVDILDVERGVRARSDARGEFLLERVGPHTVTLRLEKAGFETLEVPTQAEPSRPTVPVSVFLTPLLLPRALGEDEVLQVQQSMLRQRESGLYRFALLDPPRRDADTQAILSWRARIGDSAYGALYYPWLAVRTATIGLQPDASDAGPGLVWMPPSGHVAGMTAAVDRREGVHRSAANRTLSLVEDLAADVDDDHQAILNPAGVNCIRTFPGRGMRIYGARTLSSDPEWRYVNVRRLVLVLEETLEKSFQWAVFEPNDAFRRQAITMSVNVLLERLRRIGALAGANPESAYRVKCDTDNNPPSARDSGTLLVEVAVAPAVPFEFVVFRIGRTADAIEVTE